MSGVGRPKGTKKYTPGSLRKACKDYFASISYEEPVTRNVPVIDDEGLPVLDKYGHIVTRQEPIIALNGRKAIRTCWIESPSLQALSLYLKIDTSTFSRYLADDDLGPVAAEAKLRVEAYLAAKSEQKGAASGVKFNLSHNFGWGAKDEDRSGNRELLVDFRAEGESSFD